MSQLSKVSKIEKQLLMYLAKLEAAKAELESRKANAAALIK